MKKKILSNHNAAIYLLSSRKNYLPKCLKALFDNWNYQFNYPVYVHYFGDIYDSKIFQNKIRKEISELIFFKNVKVKIPEHIQEKDLFYNRTDINYVKKNFSKDRIGYLHMENFCTRILSFGEIGCLDADLKKYEYLMRIDDDSWFKKKIEYDLFDNLKEYPFATGYQSMNQLNQNIYDTRLGLWSFYKKFIKENNVKIKNPDLNKAYKNDNEELMHRLDWSCGNLNLYDLKYFSKYKFNEFSNKVFQNGGNYKYRWGDIEVLGLFAYTYFDKPLLNLNLKERGFYHNKIGKQVAYLKHQNIFSRFYILLKTVFFKYYTYLKKNQKILKKNLFKLFFLRFNFLFKNKNHSVYLHIPRTVGTKLQIETLEKNIYNKLITLPHKYTASKLLKMNVKSNLFVIIRNPLEWYISYFSYKIKNKKNHYIQNKDFLDFFNDIIDFENNQIDHLIWHHPFKKNSVVGEIQTIKNRNIGFFTKMIIVYTASKRELYFNKKLSDNEIINIFTSFGISNIIKIENILDINQKFLSESKNKIDFLNKINHATNNNEDLLYEIPKNIEKKIKYYDRILYSIFYQSED